MITSKLSKRNLAGMGQKLENFWFRRFHWLYFIAYVPFMAVLSLYIWNNHVRQVEWSDEDKQQYIVESGQRGREFNEEIFNKSIERIKKSQLIFDEESLEIRNIFLPRN